MEVSILLFKGSVNFLVSILYDLDSLMFSNQQVITFLIMLMLVSTIYGKHFSPEKKISMRQNENELNHQK